MLPFSAAGMEEGSTECEGRRIPHHGITKEAGVPGGFHLFIYYLLIYSRISFYLKELQRKGGTERSPTS